MLGPTLLIFVHVAGNLLWIGSILAVAVLLVANDVGPKPRGELALLVYRRLAVPGFVVSFLAGSVRLFSDVQHYLVETHYMHAKLTAAVVAIGLHHALGARAKALAAGTKTDAGPSAVLAAVLALAALVATFLVLAKPF